MLGGLAKRRLHGSAFATLSVAKAGKGSSTKLLRQTFVTMQIAFAKAELLLCVDAVVWFSVNLSKLKCILQYLSSSFYYNLFHFIYIIYI